MNSTNGKPKRRITNRSAKMRGRRLQVWVAEKISDLTGIQFGKDEDIESRPMGQTGTDVRLSKEALKLFPFSVECKNQESWSLPAWIKQTKANQMPGTDWLLFCKRNHMPEVVVLDANVFFEILAKLRGVNK